MMTLDSLSERVKTASNGLVPGLMFRVESKTLKAHLQGRSNHHKTRAEEKAKEVPKLEETVKALQDSIASIKKHGKEAEVSSIGGKMSAYNDTIGGALTAAPRYGFDGNVQVQQLEQQIEALRKDIRGHANKAASFGFLAEALFEGIYALQWDDLHLLEFVR